MKHDGGYYYLHQNGTLLWKPAIVVDADPHYFESPFVKTVWRVDRQDGGGRARFWIILLEALVKGLSQEGAWSFIHRYNLDLEDMSRFLAFWTEDLTEEQAKGMGDYFHLVGVDGVAWMNWFQEERAPKPDQDFFAKMPRATTWQPEQQGMVGPPEMEDEGHDPVR